MTTFALQGLGLASGSLLARMLGVHDRGVLAAVLLWPSILAALGDLGGPVAYAYLSSQQRDKLSRLVVNGVWLSVLQSAVLIALGFPLVAFATKDYGEVRNSAGVYLVGFIPLNLSTRYLASIHQGLNGFRRFNTIRLTVQIVYVVGVVLLFATGLGNIRSVLAVTLLSNGAVLLVAIKPFLSDLSRFRWPDLSLIRETVRYGLRAHIGNLTPVDSMQLDLALVILLLGAKEGGLYTIATSAALVVRAQGTAFGMVALPAVANAATWREKIEEGASIFRLSLVSSCLTAALIGVSAWIVVPLIYGSAFSGAVPIVQILVIGMVPAALRQVLGDCLRGSGNPLYGTAAEIVSWLTVAIALAVLVPFAGAEGAAVSVSLSYVAALTTIVFLARRMGMTTRQLFVPRKRDAALIGAIFRSVVPESLAFNGLRASSEWLRRQIRLLKIVSAITGILAFCVASGAAISLIYPSQREVLIAANGIASIGPILWRVVRRKFDIFEPLTIICSALCVMFCLRPMSLVSRDIPPHLGYDIRGTFDTSLLIAFLGIVAFVAGYSAFGGRARRAGAGTSRPKWDHESVVSYSAILFILGVFLYSLFLFQSGGVHAFLWLLKGRQTGQDALFRGSTGYLYQGLLLCCPASLLLIGSGLQRRNRPIIAAGLVAVLPVLFVFGARGGRTNLLIPIGAMACLPFLLSNRRPGRISTLVIVYLALTVGVGFFGSSRTVEDRSNSRLGLLTSSVIHPDKSVQRVLEGGDADMFDTLANLVSVVPSRLPYQPGSLFTDVLIRVVPRPLWPTKPLESNDRFIVTLWADRYSVSRGSAASSFLGELYQDAGLVTVIVGMVLFGYGSRCLWEWRARHVSNPGVQLIYASIIPYAVVLLRGNLVTSLSLAAFTLFPLILAIHLFQARGVVSGPFIETGPYGPTHVTRPT